MIKKLGLTAVCSVFLLSGCGGGGSSTTTPPATPPSSSTPPVTPEPNKPKISIGNLNTDSDISPSFNIEEGIKEITSVKLDTEGTIIILGGEDADLFVLTGSKSNEKTLSFVEAPKYLTPTDEDQDNVYNVNIQGSNTDGKSVTVKASYIINLPASYTVTASAASKNNHSDTFAPKIGSFSVSGNMPSEDGRAIISKKALGGKFSYTVSIEDYFYAKKLYTGITPGDMSIISLTSILSREGGNKFDCILDASSGSKGVNYTCNNLSLVNDSNYTSLPAETKFYAVVCSNDRNETDALCSSASVDVKFTE